MIMVTLSDIGICAHCSSELMCSIVAPAVRTAYTILLQLIEGTAHKHDKVRSCCLDSLAFMLDKLPVRDPLPAGAKLDDGKETQAVFSQLEDAIERGLSDSSSPSRVAARSLLVSYHRVSKTQSERYRSSVQCTGEPCVLNACDCKRVQDYCKATSHCGQTVCPGARQSERHSHVACSNWYVCCAVADLSLTIAIVCVHTHDDLTCWACASSQSKASGSEG